MSTEQVKSWRSMSRVERYAALERILTKPARPLSELEAKAAGENVLLTAFAYSVLETNGKLKMSTRRQ